MCWQLLMRRCCLHVAPCPFALNAAAGGRGSFEDVPLERTKGLDLTKSFCAKDGPDSYEQASINLWANSARGDTRGRTRGGGVLGRSTFSSSSVPRFTGYGTTTNEGSAWRSRNIGDSSLRESFRFYEPDAPKFNKMGSCFTRPSPGGSFSAPRRGVYAGPR